MKAYIYRTGSPLLSLMFFLGETNNAVERCEESGIREFVIGVYTSHLWIIWGSHDMGDNMASLKIGKVSEQFEATNFRMETASLLVENN